MVLGLCVPAAAAKPSVGCPMPAGWVQVDAEGWWDATVEGTLEEGLTLEEAADLFGFDSVAALKEDTIAGALSFDRNGNGLICKKEMPPALPAYFFNLIDDQASVPG
jgi:hypothetical protein